MPQIPSLFGISPDDANLAIQGRDEQHALDVAHLNNGQLQNYNGAHVGDMLGQGILSAFGLQDPIAAKANKIQQVQQLTEQQAPWEADPEAHMKLAVSNLMKAGLQTEAGNAYQSLLDWKKNQVQAMNAQSIADELNLKKQDRAAQDKADADFSNYLQNLQNPQGQQPQQSPDTPTGAFDLSSPANVKALQDNIAKLRETNPDEADKVQLALDNQVKQSTQFTPPTDPALIDRAMMSGSPKAVAWAKLMKAENDKAQALWTTQNVVSANTKAFIDSAEKRQNTVSANTQYTNENRASKPVAIIGDDGTPIYVNQSDAVGQAPAPKGNGSSVNLAGGRESTQINRVMMAGNQVARDLENVVKLPLTSSRGIFGGRGQGQSLFEASKETLANTMTSQDVQSYNTMATGFQRNLAAIEAAGLMPSGTLTHQMDAVIFKEGDTNLTKLQKLAQTRQIVEAGLETLLTNPRISDEQKAGVQKTMDKLSKAVPFTQDDLIALTVAQQKNPKVTLKNVMDTMNKALPSDIPNGSKLIGKSPSGQDVYQSPDGKRHVSTVGQ